MKNKHLQNFNEHKLNEDMDQNEFEQIIQNYIKNNLRIEISTKEYKSECSYNSQTYIELVLNDEVISSCEIEGLGEDR